MDGKPCYKVRFSKWGPEYDAWFKETDVYSFTSTIPLCGAYSRGSIDEFKGSVAIEESRDRYLKNRIEHAPALLQSLSAMNFLSHPDRGCGLPFLFSFSFINNSWSAVGLLRAAMLIIEAALPLGAVDFADDRWGDNFVVPWRESVWAAQDASALMQCQIMLEYGIRTAWLRPTGLKLFSCLPSRAQAMRTATCGAVAIRLWVLDQTIRYDKVHIEGAIDVKSKTNSAPKTEQVAIGASKKKKLHR
jgi:hypothetical protein